MKEQMLNGFTKMMKGLWNNQDLEVPNLDTACKQEPCSDTVSRQAVLDIVCGNCDYYDENKSQYDRIKELPSLHHLCDGCKHKDDQNKIEFGKVSPCIFCLRSAHDNYERDDTDENSSQKVGT